MVASEVPSSPTRRSPSRVTFSAHAAPPAPSEARAWRPGVLQAWLLLLALFLLLSAAAFMAYPDEQVSRLLEHSQQQAMRRGVCLFPCGRRRGPGRAPWWRAGCPYRCGGPWEDQDFGLSQHLVLSLGTSYGTLGLLAVVIRSACPRAAHRPPRSPRDGARARSPLAAASARRSSASAVPSASARGRWRSSRARPRPSSRRRTPPAASISTGCSSPSTASRADGLSFTSAEASATAWCILVLRTARGSHGLGRKAPAPRERTGSAVIRDLTPPPPHPGGFVNI